MTKSRWGALLLALALVAPAAAEAAQWWRIGQQTDGDWVYIDADSFDMPLMGDVAFSGRFVYATPYTLSNGDVATYEEFFAELDCSGRTLYSVERAFYRRDHSLITSVEDDEIIAVNDDQASGWEYAFVCNNERAGGAHGFTALSGAPN